MQIVEKKIRILSKVYYFLGILCLPASFITPWIIQGVIKDESVPFPASAILTGLSILILLTSIGISICILFVAQSIDKKRNYNFCVVISSLLCLSIPVGTAIGIWALILLNDLRIKKLFEADK
jgi:hypothetical protein